MNDPLNNLFRFYVGQKIVALKSGRSGSSSVKVGDVFTVRANHLCPGCGKRCIDIGFKPDNGISISCSTTCDVMTFDGVLWTNQTGFAPLEQTKFPLMTFSEILKHEEKEVLVNN